jgi:hypothetical protein
MLYELITPAGRNAAAQRYVTMVIRDLDRAIKRRLEELHESDPELCALAMLKRVAVALPEELLRRQWIPAVDDAGEVRWRPPQS